MTVDQIKTEAYPLLLQDRIIPSWNEGGGSLSVFLQGNVSDGLFKQVK